MQLKEQPNTGPERDDSNSPQIALKSSVAAQQPPRLTKLTFDLKPETTEQLDASRKSIIKAVSEDAGAFQPVVQKVYMIGEFNNVHSKEDNLRSSKMSNSQLRQSELRRSLSKSKTNSMIVSTLGNGTAMSPAQTEEETMRQSLNIRKSTAKLPPTAQTRLSQNREKIDMKLQIKEELSLLYQAEVKNRASRRSSSMSQRMSKSAQLTRTSLAQTNAFGEETGQLTGTKKLLNVVREQPFYHELCKRSSVERQWTERIRGADIRPATNSYMDRNIEYYVKAYRKLENMPYDRASFQAAPRGTGTLTDDTLMCGCPIHGKCPVGGRH